MLLQDEVSAVVAQRRCERLEAAALHRKARASKPPARSFVAGSLRRLADVIEPYPSTH